jgi:methyl-accepting chemotaxis protein
MTSVLAQLQATSLHGLRINVARILIWVAVIHAPLLAVVAALRHVDVVTTAVAAVLLAGVPALLFRLRRPVLVTSLALAVALVGQTSILVFLMKGHPWQVEMHFYYFAVLAMLAGFCDWRALCLGAVLIALEHFTFNWVLPEAIYAGGSDLPRMLVHAWVVIVETTVLIAIGAIIRNAFATLETMRANAETLAADLARTADSRQTMLNETSAQAKNTRELLDRFEREMSQSIETLHQRSIGLIGNADRLGVASSKTTAQMVAVSTASENTAREVQAMAQAGQELSQTIHEVGVSAAKSSELAAAAVQEADRANATMNDMAAVSAEIGQVTDLISGIAAQTNLLALNATIEAARAGEAGRGFTVVAQEVKALAGQTAQATQDIAKRVAAMQDTSGRSVAAIHAVSKKIRELENVATIIAAAVNEQAIATHEIAANVTSAASSVSHVERSVSTIEDLTTQSGEVVIEVSDSAQALVQQTGTIRERVRDFTTDIGRLRA